MKSTPTRVEKLLRVFVIAAPLILFLPALLSGKVLFWGLPATQFIPWKYLAFEELRQGIFPLWNPFNGMGAPLLANYQLAFFYPPGWLSYLLAVVGGVSWLAWSETLLVALHLCWASAGMMLVSRKLQVAFPGQLISALAFGLSGFMVARVNFFSLVIAAAWLPWVFLTVTSLVDELLQPGISWQTVGRKFLNLWLCIALQLLAGHAQISFYTLLLTGLWVCFRGFRGVGWRGMVKGVAGLAGAIFLAVLTTAAQLLPTAELLLQSQRSGNVDYEIAMVYSFWPWRFLTLLFPNFFGSPGLGNYWGYANFWEDAAYIGLLPLVAAVGTLIKLPVKLMYKQESEKSIVQVFLWLIVLIGFILALGKNTPVFPFLYRHIPTFDMFNGPARFLIWVEFALAILAGMGIEIWTKPIGRRLFWTRLAVAGSIAITIGAVLSQFSLQGVNMTFIPAAATAGLLGAGIAILSLLTPGRGDERRQSMWLPAVVLLVTFDLCLVNRNLNVFLPADFFMKAIPNKPLNSSREGQRAFLPPDSEYRMKFEGFFNFDTYSLPADWDALWKSMLPNTNIFTGTQMVNNFDPLLPAPLARLNTEIADLDESSMVRLLEHLSVSELNIVGNENPDERQVTYIAAKERYRLYSCATVVPNADAAWQEMVRRSDRQDEEESVSIIIEGQEDQTENQCRGKAAGKIEVISQAPDHLVLEVNAEKSGWLEISESWYPGWAAAIDGERTEILRSSYFFKAVNLAPGEHIVEFQYRPKSFSLGGVVSGISIVFALLVLYLSSKKVT